MAAVRDAAGAKRLGFPSTPLSRLLFTLTVSMLLLLPFHLHAAQVKLAWNPNSEPTLKGYRIHCGVASGQYGSVADVGKTTQAVVGDLKEGTTYYFAATAYDIHGNESDFSKELVHSVPKNEGAPGGGTSKGSVKLSLEAEEGLLTGAVKKVRHSEASGGRFIRLPARGSLSPNAEPGAARIIFTVPSAGEYFVLVRIMSGPAGDNLYRVSMDDGEETAWPVAVGGRGVWIHDYVREKAGGPPRAFHLGKGEHTFTLEQGGQVLDVDQVVVTSRADLLPGTIYEDGEGGGIEGWEVVRQVSPGAAVVNVFDGLLESQVLELKGEGLKDVFRLWSREYKVWNNRGQFVAQWTMRATNPFVVSFLVATTEGPRTLSYRPLNKDPLGDGRIVQLGLGAKARDGAWRTFVRDLQGDLEKAHPGAKIVRVNGMLVRGSGQLDAIGLRGVL